MKGTGERIVLAEVARLALATGRRIVDPLDAEAAVASRGVEHDEWFAAVQALVARKLLAYQSAPPSVVVLLALTPTGLLRHLRRTRPDLDDVESRLLAAASEAPPNHPVDLAGQLSEPALLVECLLDELVDRKALVYSKAPGRRFRVHRVGKPAASPGAAASTTEASAGEAAAAGEPAGP